MSELYSRNLFYCLQNPADNSQLYTNYGEFTRTITGEIKDELNVEFEQLQNDCSPTGANMDEEAMEDLIDTLKKKPAVTHLSFLNTKTLHELIITMANQLQSLQQDNG